MKINIVTGKPADGGAARCLKISEQADEVIDFFGTLRANKGVLEETGEKFVNIALFQRPTTTKRSSFPENAAPAPDPQKPVDEGKKEGKAAKSKPAKAAAGSEDDTGI